MKNKNHQAPRSGPGAGLSAHPRHLPPLSTPRGRFSTTSGSPRAASRHFPPTFPPAFKFQPSLRPHLPGGPPTATPTLASNSERQPQLSPLRALPAPGPSSHGSAADRPPVRFSRRNAAGRARRALTSGSRKPGTTTRGSGRRRMVPAGAAS